MDGGTLAAVIGGLVVVTSAFVTGLWQWLSGRKKSSIDAQASLITGFVELLKSVQGERDRLLGRIDDCEAHNQKLDRMVSKFVRALRKNNIDIPDGDDE